MFFLADSTFPEEKKSATSVSKFRLFILCIFCCLAFVVVKSGRRRRYFSQGNSLNNLKMDHPVFVLEAKFLHECMKKRSPNSVGITYVHDFKVISLYYNVIYTTC